MHGIQMKLDVVKIEENYCQRASGPASQLMAVCVAHLSTSIFPEFLTISCKRGLQPPCQSSL